MKGKGGGARWAGRLLITVVIGLTTLSLIIYLSGKTAVFKRFFSANPLNIFLLFLTSIFIIFIDASRTYFLLKSLGRKINIFKAVENSILGFYVSAITPFSAGGQPFQMWHLTKIGATVEESTMVVGLKFITSFSITILWGLIAFSKYKSFIKSIPIIGKLVYVGLIISFAMYAFFLLLLLNSRFIKSILSSAFISYPMAFFLRKDRSYILSLIEEKVTEYKKVLATFWRRSKGYFMLNILLSAFMILSILSTTYFSLSAVNKDLNYIEIISIQVALNLVVYFLPTPGATGGVEGAFYLAFSAILNRDDVAAALVLWRFFTYYLTIILGNITSVRFLLNSKNSG